METPSHDAGRKNAGVAGEDVVGAGVIGLENCFVCLFFFLKKKGTKKY